MLVGLEPPPLPSFLFAASSDVGRRHPAGQRCRRRRRGHRRGGAAAAAAAAALSPRAVVGLGGGALAPRLLHRAEGVARRGRLGDRQRHRRLPSGSRGSTRRRAPRSAAPPAPAAPRRSGRVASASSPPSARRPRAAPAAARSRGGRSRRCARAPAARSRASPGRSACRARGSSDLVQAGLAFERGERQPRPLHAGEARRVLAGVDADDARVVTVPSLPRRRSCSSALRAVMTPASTSRPAAAWRDWTAMSLAPSALASTSSVPRESSMRRRLLVRQRLQVDAAAAARFGERAQRRRIAAGGAGDREHRHRERQPPRRAVVRQAVAEPERLGRDAVVAHRAEVAGAVVHRRLQGAAQRRPVAAADAEALRREGDVGDAHQRHLAVAGAAEVGVEQGLLAIELALRARARGVPDDLHAARQRPRRAALGHRQGEGEEGLAVALLGRDLDRVAVRGRRVDAQALARQGRVGERAAGAEAAARIALEDAGRAGCRFRPPAAAAPRRSGSTGRSAAPRRHRRAAAPAGPAPPPPASARRCGSCPASSG